MLGQAKPGFTTAQSYRIAGIVYDATSGQTLPGARVALGSTAEGHAPDRSVLSAPDGSFAFEHLAAGKYQMYGEALGYPQQGFEEHEPPFLTGVVVGPDESADHLAFRMQRGSGISGIVTDEFNDPVRSAQVILFRRGLADGRFSTHFMREGMTDDLGHYKFAPLFSGTYFVVVQARPWYAHTGTDESLIAAASAPVIENMKRLDVAFPLAFYSGAADATDATPIPLRSGDRATADFSLHSAPAASVTFHQSTAVNEQFPFVRFTQQLFGDFELPVQTEQRPLFHPRPGEGVSALTDMVLGGIAPGSYLAHLNLSNGQGERIEEIEIDGDTTLDPDSFQEQASASAHAVVRMAGSAAPKETIVVLRNVKTNDQDAERPDDKGQMDFKNLAPGTYEVSVANSRDTYLLQMSSPNVKINGRELTLSAASPAELEIVLGKGMAEIHGVALRDGKGLGGTLVLLVPENPDANAVLFRRDQSDSDGTFALPSAVPGKYSVVSIDGGWDLQWSRAEVLKPYLAKATEIEVAANGKYDVKVQVQKK
jgi:hypothetical protein